jgi:MazG family protein
MPKNSHQNLVNSATASRLDNATRVLLELVATLRGEKGCPWDRKQTPGTIIRHLQEESYELMEAIGHNDPQAVCEELGDVLFHIFFLARIYSEQGHFDIADVMSAVSAKMIRRHPHVFGTAEAGTPEEVHAQWQRLKTVENNAKGIHSALDGVPGQMPALMRAYRISQRAVAVGFDWDDLSAVMKQVEAEWRELKAELKDDVGGDGRHQSQMMEFGDLLFTLVNVARFMRFHPETALTTATGKFEQRFRRMEIMAAHRGQKLEDLPRQTLEELWVAVKAEE